ncbi:MAG: peroxidase [Rhodobacterales bacterium CG2_30_65_12]|nr:MAG: peroxidase [Rhodobacterales bacterium CG2_30_65_12]
MGLRINDTVPNFHATTDKGEIDFHDFIGDSYTILFSHPADFTPICTTEFGAVAQLADEWEKRGVKVIGLSVDSVEDHVKWKADISSFAKAPATFPIIADTDLAVSKALDMLPAEAYLPENKTANDSQTVRVVFIIGPDKKLRLSMTYPMSVGRNFAEVLRALDAVMASDGSVVRTPANWTPGTDVIVAPSMSTEDAKAKFGDVKEVFPYLRFMKDPNA